MSRCKANTQVYANARGLQRGFTLIELLISLTIFAVIGMGTFSLLTSFTSAKESADTSAAALSELQRAFTVMERDFSQMAPRAIRDPFGGDIDLPAVKMESDIDIEFTRAGNAVSRFVKVPRSDLVRVRYWYEEGEIKRGQYSVLDRAPDTELDTLTLLDGVDDFRMEVYDVDEKEGRLVNTPLTQWPPIKDPTQPEPLTLVPRAVRITMNKNPYGELERWFLVAVDF